MKRLALLAITAFVAVTLSACGENTQRKTETETTGTVQTPTTDTTTTTTSPAGTGETTPGAQ